ncbi:hypothetical protein IGI37_001409 [Enterococcus sp. AZ194]|uniref:helix-turn-helix domain-containing protein n=1 Tax=Enterococcus sp. AZ194 TaxID=2774629 RepID=UPI003F1F1C4A
MNIQKNIKSLRQRQGLTQNDLAQKLTVSAGAVSKWETGMSIPDTELLILLARLFRVSLDELFGFDLVLSKEQMNEIETDLRTSFQEEGFNKGVAKTDSYLNEHTQSEPLQFICAKLIWEYRIFCPFKDEQEIQARLQLAFDRFLPLFDSDNQKIQVDSLYCRAAILMSLERYEKLEELLQKIPENNYDTFSMRLTVSEFKREYEKASSLALLNLFKTVNKLYSLLAIQICLEGKMENEKQTKIYSKLLKKTEELFQTIAPSSQLFELDNLIKENKQQEAAEKMKQFIQEFSNRPLGLNEHFLFSEISLSANDWELIQARKLYMEELIKMYKEELSMYSEYTEAASLVDNYDSQNRIVM